jgi:hypothetical protein
MLKNYFEIIRFAISQKRKKADGVYYESHHIVPKSLGKNSATVLLTPEEHYKAHRYLAEAFAGHTSYGQKMLWAFHRMAYDKDRRITKEEYAEARSLLMPLWKRKKTEEWKEKMSNIMIGNTNGLGGKKNWIASEEQRQRYSEAATKRQLGKVGEESRASKGAVIYEKYDGTIIEAGSALQLSKILGIHNSTIQFRLRDKPGLMYKGYSISYKENH